MTLEKLALLRSLALRPGSQVAPALRALVDELSQDGYITCGRDGWTATAEGCMFIERQRGHSLGPGTPTQT
jgi:hypothetical protein